MNARPAWAALACAALACAAASPARAGESPADSTMHSYFRALSDSTDAYFGLSAQPADTAGLDSALAAGLARPPGMAPRGALRLSLAPAFSFNRALGAVYGGSAALGLGRAPNRLAGQLQWANGPNQWYGGGELLLGRARPRQDASVTLSVSGGRRFEALNRDRYSSGFATLNALVWGSDRHSYLRRDGVRAELAHRGAAGWSALAYRWELESPLSTTAGWTLTGAGLEVEANAPAVFGRASELSVSAGARLPWAPFAAEATLWNAGGALGGDLAYHRYRAAFGGGIPLGAHLALAPQLEYARLRGAPLAQDALYVGGSYSLLTVPSQSLAGTGRAIARVDLLLQDDVPTLLGLRRNPAFPLQAGVFATTAARWGFDPASGAPRIVARNWPRAGEWMPEAGLSLMYRPGLPDPETWLRVDYAWPLGPGDRDATLYVSWKRTLHLLSGR
ncbi:MAG: hypothetical protein IT347_12415 [Candidatus Eisenbacteria bacterium]|nr:hypothetical protein [Candidatus Eisenbacteria bacterium]